MTSRLRGKRAEVGRRKVEVIHRRRAGRQMAARSVVCGHNEAGRRQKKHCNSHQWPLERPVGPSASHWRRAAWACMNNIVLLDGLFVVTRPGMHTGHFGVLGGCCGSSVRPGGSEMSTSSTLDRKRGHQKKWIRPNLSISVPSPYSPPYSGMRRSYGRSRGGDSLCAGADGGV